METQTDLSAMNEGYVCRRGGGLRQIPSEPVAEAWLRQRSWVGASWEEGEISSRGFFGQDSRSGSWKGRWGDGRVAGEAAVVRDRLA